MSATPTSLDPDLVKLEAEGYRLQVIHGASGAHHLIVEEIPAVNSHRQVVRGKLYCPLELDSTGKSKLRVPAMTDSCSGDDGHPRSEATQAGGLLYRLSAMVPSGIGFAHRLG
jgi:hypothetical protein